MIVTSALLTTIVGLLLSFLFEYIPGFSGWFEKKTSQTKKLLMLGFLAVSAGAMVAIACGGLAELVGLSVTCDQVGILEIVLAFFGALGLGAATNQGFYSLTKKPDGDKPAAMF